MKCLYCKNRKERRQDGGIKVLCIAFGGEEIGSGQSATGDPAFPLAYHRTITGCDCYAPKEIGDRIKVQAIGKVFTRDEPNRQGMAGTEPNRHPFGG